MSIWDWIRSNHEALGVVVALIAAVGAAAWTLIQFITAKQAEAKRLRFETYHRLIKELVAPDDAGKTYADRQIAVVFELRNFPSYAPVSRRILKGLRESWGVEAPSPARTRLLEEIDIAYKFLEGETPKQKLALWLSSALVAVALSMSLYSLAQMLVGT